MDKEKIRFLIEKFNNGNLSPVELTELEQLIEDGQISIMEFPSLASLDQSLEKIMIPETGKDMDSSFYGMLEKRKNKSQKPDLAELFNRIRQAFFALINNPVAYPALLLATGFSLAFLFNFGSGKKQIRALSTQINQVHEMLVVSLLEKPDATDRLKAVSLTSDIKSADNKVIDALLNTLDHDDNVNVRLAAIDALFKYSVNDRVRKGLVESLQYQDSPIVLVTLADVLVALQEKSSLDRLRQLLKNKDLNNQVKDKIITSIKKMS